LVHDLSVTRPRGLEKHEISSSHKTENWKLQTDRIKHNHTGKRNGEIEIFKIIFCSPLSRNWVRITNTFLSPDIIKIFYFYQLLYNLHLTADCYISLLLSGSKLNLNLTYDLEKIQFCLTISTCRVWDSETGILITHQAISQCVPFTSVREVWYPQSAINNTQHNWILWAGPRNTLNPSSQVLYPLGYRQCSDTPLDCPSTPPTSP